MLATPEKRWPDMSRDERKEFTRTAAEFFASARAAADFIGTTKNSILSFMGRYEVPVRFPMNTSPDKPKFNAFVRRREATPEERKRDAIVKEDRKPSQREAHEKAAWEANNKLPAWDALPDTEPKPLWQLGACECHWPVYRDGEPDVFCSAPTPEGEVYCTTHRRIGGGRYAAKSMPGDRAERKARLR